MTENQMDGGSAEGTATNANGGASENQSVQQPSFDAAKLQATLDAVVEGQKTLEARVNGLQGVKDKTIDEITGLKGKIAEYEQLKEKLGSSESAMEQLELRETLAQMNQKLEQLSGSVSTQSGGTGASGAVDAAKAFEGFDQNDARVAMAMQKQYGSQEDAEFAAFKLSRKLKQAPSPTQAQQPAEQGNPEPPLDADAKTKKYIKDMQAARGKPGEIKRLREQAIKDGVKTWEIDFS